MPERPTTTAGGDAATLERPAPPAAPPLRGGGPGTPPATAGRPAGRAAPAATVALTLLTLAAAAGFARVFATSEWLGPVAVTASGAHLVAWAARRARLHPLAAAVVGGAAVTLLSVWTVLPASTTLGLPLRGTWRAVGDALAQAQSVFSSTIAPVPAIHGFVLMAAAGAGLVALLADWLALRLEAPLPAAAPAVALFVVCSVSGTPRGRTWSAALLVAAAIAHLLVHRATIGPAGAIWFGNRSGGAAGWTLAVGAGVGAVAVLATLVITPTLPRTDGHGLLGWKGSGPGAGGGDREVPSPIVDLETRLLQKSATEVFTVRSPVPSYWRLTSLDQFNGQQWQSTDSYQGVAHRLPGVAPASPGTRTVTEEFHIQALDSIWMPTAFSPESITGGGHVSWDAVSGSLLASKATSDGLSYQLTSLQHLETVSAARLSRAPTPPIDPSTARYVALPPSVPPAVKRLARTITAGATDEYAKALALQDYFIDNPAFSYSLEPPADGYGIDALTTFLFQTRVGYCQQFAGAYAVLARAVGLPTRLAVGFTTGDTTGPGTYQVLDADAHTWPEVWFGRSIGWLPFEPTKGGGFSIPGATGYTGNTARISLVPLAPAEATTPTTATRVPGHSLARPLPRDAASPAPLPVAVRHRSNAPVLLGLGAALAAGTVWMAVNGVGRRLRWRRRRRRAAGGAQRILVAWAETCELLAWWHCRRRADETPAEFAARAGRQLQVVLGDHSSLRHLRALAAAAGAASYAEGQPEEGVVEAAVTDAEIVGRLLLDAAPRSRLIERLVDPRLAWGRAPVDPPASFGAPAAPAYDSI